MGHGSLKVVGRWLFASKDDRLSRHSTCSPRQKQHLENCYLVAIRKRPLYDRQNPRRKPKHIPCFLPASALIADLNQLN